MILSDLLKQIEHTIPLSWALPDDPVGLQIGNPKQEVKRVFVTLELNSKRMQKAMQKKCGLLLLHHPLLFRPLKRICENDPVQRLTREIIKHDMACYGMHTNIDLHPEGMAKLWAKKLGCVDYQCLMPKPQAGMMKIVTFAPKEHTHAIRQDLSKAGAGNIGEYSKCSFTTSGLGSFQGSDQSKPFVGKAGVFEQEPEERLEMIFPVGRKNAIVNSLHKIHPYEEPAYDIYPLESIRGLAHAVWIADFGKKLQWNEFESRIYNSIKGIPHITTVRPNPKHKIRRIAISTGSGSSFLPIIGGLDVDCYLTGEMGYHIQWEAMERGITVALVGHDYSESLFPETVVSILKPHMKEITWVMD
jgi:dinuclear metal center YbgI/SA1388 family protein